jgi:hypothetical protein
MFCYGRCLYYCGKESDVPQRHFAEEETALDVYKASNDNRGHNRQ